MLGLGLNRRLGLGLPRRGSDPSAAFALYLPFKAGGTYRSGSTTASSVSALPGYTYTRSGAKSELTASSGLTSFAANVPGIVQNVGYWSREAATNILLNAGSATNLVTQSVSVSAQAYTLSFIGTGTVTLSGTSTAGPLVGTGANDRVTLTFTPTAGTLTLTVSGTVQYAVLVASVSSGPIIATTGSAASTGMDVLRTDAAIASGDGYFLAVADFEGVAQHHTLCDFANADATHRIKMAVLSGQLLVEANAGASAYLTTSGGAVSTGDRVALAVFYRGGTLHYGYSRNGGAATIVTVGTRTPPTLTRVFAGISLDSVHPARAPVEAIRARSGTFSNAEMSAILQAA